MPSDFDPLKVAAQAASGAAGLVAGAASVVSGAANVVSDAASFVSDALAPKDEDEPPNGLPDPDYTGDIREGAEIDTKKIYVHRVKQSPDGEISVGQAQYLRLSVDGVELLASTKLFAKPIARVRPRNCYVYKHGQTKGDNPFLKSLGFGILLGATNGDPVTGLILGALSTRPPEDIWYAEIIQHDTDERYVFVLQCKSDGDAILEFLDQNMHV